MYPKYSFLCIFWEWVIFEKNSQIMHRPHISKSRQVSQFLHGNCRITKYWQSALFNGLTLHHVLVVNYPFYTIKSKTVRIEITCENFDLLVDLYNPKKKVFFSKIYDITSSIKYTSKTRSSNKFWDNLVTLRINNFF